MDILIIIEKLLIVVGCVWIVMKCGLFFYKHFTTPASVDLRNGVQQRRVFCVNEEFEKTFDECLASLKLLKKINLKNIDKEHGVLTAGVGMTLWSFGEKVEISIKEKKPDLLELSVSSKPRLWPVWEDGAKNFDNVEILVEQIKSALTIREKDSPDIK